MITREVLLANVKLLEEQFQETIAQLRRLEGAIGYNKLLLDKLRPGQSRQPARYASS